MTTAANKAAITPDGSSSLGFNSESPFPRCPYGFGLRQVILTPPPQAGHESSQAGQEASGAQARGDGGPDRNAARRRGQGAHAGVRAAGLTADARPASAAGAAGAAAAPVAATAATASVVGTVAAAVIGVGALVTRRADGDGGGLNRLQLDWSEQREVMQGNVCEAELGDAVALRRKGDAGKDTRPDLGGALRLDSAGPGIKSERGVGSTPVRRVERHLEKVTCRCLGQEHRGVGVSDPDDGWVVAERESETGKPAVSRYSGVGHNDVDFDRLADRGRNAPLDAAHGAGCIAGRVSVYGDDNARRLAGSTKPDEQGHGCYYQSQQRHP